MSDTDIPFDQADFEPAEKPFNVYAYASAMSRSVLFGQLSEPVLRQAHAFLSYRDLESAAATVTDFTAKFDRKYGVL